MNKSDFERVTIGLPKDSIRLACYIVREYRRCESGNNLELCAVTKEQYDMAVNMLLAFAYQNSDEKTVVEQYYCESDCCKNNGLSGFCDGEFEITKDTKKRVCRRYWNPSNI